MIVFIEPIWLSLALPLLAALLWWPPPGRLVRGLRVLVSLLLTLGVAGIALRLPGRGGTVVVVADRSASMPPNAERQQREAIETLAASRGAQGRLGVVAFGVGATVDTPPTVASAGSFAGFSAAVGDGASNLREGLETAISLVPPETGGRLLVLSDGLWTGAEPAGAAARAAARGIAIDYRLIARPSVGDLAIDTFEAPPRVGVKQGFMIAAWIRSPDPGKVKFELRRGQTRIAAGAREVAAGLTRLTFRDIVDEPGAALYTLRVAGDNDDDPVPQNNTARLIVGVDGERRALLVSAKPQSNLARLLSQAGVKLSVQPPERLSWTLEELGQWSAVIIEEVRANDIGPAGMETLAEWVKHAGGGLMMTGGPSSFGPGGYFRSPLEPILPVSMEMRREHRKHQVAIVVALDRSGSMGMTVPGGRTKMDLANLGTAQVLDMLGPNDEIGVIAVDTSPHVIVPLSNAVAPEALRRRILGIQSMGGGIYVHDALIAATRMLAGSTAGTRHIILFSDAMDSEKPGEYRRILQEARAAGITCSVIGLGRDGDADAGLLKDVAARGEGRIFFTEDANQLPRLFAEDTFVVARGGFVEEQAPTKFTPAAAALFGRSFATAPIIGGYSLAYLRDEAEMALVTEDEYAAPVIAAWRAGAGRTLCYTAQVDGQFTGWAATWRDIGELLAGMARWTIGDPGNLGPDMLLTHKLVDDILQVRLHVADAAAAARVGEPKLTALYGAAGATPSVETSRLRWLAPDELGADLPMRGGHTTLATVTIGTGAAAKSAALPPVVMPYSPEFRPVEGRRGIAELRALARTTGGIERIDLAKIWGELPRTPRMVNIAPALLMAAAMVFLLEILERRSGWLSALAPKLSFARLLPGASRPRTSRPNSAAAASGAPGNPQAPATAAAKATTPRADTPPPTESTNPAAQGGKPAPPTESPSSMLDAMSEARRRARQRHRE